MERLAHNLGLCKKCGKYHPYSKYVYPNYKGALAGHSVPGWCKGLNKENSEIIKKRSEKQKITLRKKYQNGYVNPMLGKKRPDVSEYNRKYKSIQMKGENNPNKRAEVIAKRKKTIAGRTKELYGRPGPLNRNWKGGKYYEPYTYEFNYEIKQKIKQRDNYTCQLCGAKEGTLKQNLCVHHIDYNKDNSKEYNLITLCHICNTKVNSKRQNWTEFFIDKMKTQKNMLEELKWEDFIQECLKIYEFLKNKKVNKLVAIPRGGLIPAVVVSNLLKVDIVFRVTSDDDVIIDEIVDFGLTFRRWKKKHPKNLFVCLHINKKHFKQQIKPDFYVREVDKFIRYPWEQINDEDDNQNHKT